MRVLNSRPDKFLIQCIELDLFDILSKHMLNQLNRSLAEEAEDLLKKYRSSGMLKDFNILSTGVDFIKVEVYIPKKTEIECRLP